MTRSSTGPEPRPRPIIPALLALLALAGCSQHLTDASVRRFIDDADEAYARGRGPQMCHMRSKDFKLTSIDYDLAPGRVVADQAEAEAIAAARQERGEVLEARTTTLDVRDLCLNLWTEGRKTRRDTLERSDLRVDVEPGGQRATVRAHYRLLQPVYELGESALGQQDAVEHQVATLQVEADDESVVVLEQGEPVFLSTRSTSRSFRIAARRDERL